MTIVAQAHDSLPPRDYYWLKEAVADWLHRDGLIERIPDFIMLAEREINRRLTVTPKEIETQLLTVIGSRHVALPANYGSPVGLWLDNVAPRRTLTKVTAPQLPVDDATQRAPCYWAIDGKTIAFDAPANEVYPLAFRYLQSLYLSEESPTNDLFERAPDLYLYGALAQSAPYTMSDERLGMWKNEFASLLRSVAAESARDKAVPLQTEIAAALCGSRARGGWGY